MELKSDTMYSPGPNAYGDVPWLSPEHHRRELSLSKNSTQISRILNSKELAELRVGHIGVDALCATAPLALVWAPPLGF